MPQDNCIYDTLFLQTGWTPFHIAARNGHLHIVRELVEKLNADVLATKPVCSVV